MLNLMFPPLTASDMLNFSELDPWLRISGYIQSSSDPPQRTMYAEATPPWITPAGLEEALPL